MPPCSTLFEQLWPCLARPGPHAVQLRLHRASLSQALAHCLRSTVDGEVLSPTSPQRPTGQLLQLHRRSHPLVSSVPPPPTSSPYPDQTPHSFPVLSPCIVSASQLLNLHTLLNLTSPATSRTSRI
jgi:hypothetical protein